MSSVPEQITIDPAGSVEMVIHQEGEKVVQRFRRPMEWVAYEAQNAIDVGTAMIDAAYAVRGDLKPASGAVKHALGERHRRTLETRFTIMLKSMREEKKMTDRQVAEQLVSTALAEIL